MELNQVQMLKLYCVKVNIRITRCPNDNVNSFVDKDILRQQTR